MGKRKQQPATPLPKLRGVGIAVLIGLALLALLFVIPTVDKQDQPLAPVLPPGPVINPNAAQSGDIVSINYVLQLEDGTLVDANGDIAKKAGLKTYSQGPFQFKLGKSQKVKGFDEAIIGMLPGDQKIVTINPSEPITRVLINKTKHLFKNQPISRIHFYKIDAFKKVFNKPPIVNDVVRDRSLSYNLQVLNYSSKTVAVQALVKEGDTIQVPGLPWESKVLAVYDRMITVRHNPKNDTTITSFLGDAKVTVGRSDYFIHYTANVGQLLNFSTPIAGEDSSFVAPHLFKVTDVSDEAITIEREDNLAEKKLTLEVTLVELTKK
ncbi:FKBP-type peptidyl-prolyl cis-trans isomerase [Candidatus Woesearchaeota archaeon]|nr:FKBP-type peptidyl-prolyl cis-trans isomerase [Candidatus Woesearchaeota archaeon]